MKKENWEKEFDERYYDINTPSGLKQGKFLNFIIMVKDIKSFIRHLLKQEKEKLIKEFIEGKRCLNCGAKKESNLTDLCDKCLED